MGNSLAKKQDGDHGHSFRRGLAYDLERREVLVGCDTFALEASIWLQCLLKLADHFESAYPREDVQGLEGFAGVNSLWGSRACSNR